MKDMYSPTGWGNAVDCGNALDNEYPFTLKKTAPATQQARSSRMTDKPTPTDAELEALLLDKLPASKHYIRPVIEKMVAAMQAAIDKWGQPALATQQAGEPSYSEKWDAELGRTAMRFVDRAGDVRPGIDDAETICAEFYKAMSEVIERMPHVQRMTPRKAAPGVGNSGFDHKTAADFLNGKTVSDEAVRKFVAASRWAHDERAALSATLLAMHGVLTSREAEIALLKKALMEAKAAPQQEAQEPVAWESTTPGYIKYITQARYEKFSPNVQRWYKPYRCSGCAERGAGFDACDMATAAAQGFRSGQAAAKQEE